MYSSSFATCLGLSGPAIHRCFKIDPNGFKELLGCHPRLIGTDENRKILGHMAIFDSLDADFLQRFGNADDVRRFIELAAIFESTRPCETGRDRVGRRGFALLLTQIMSLPGGMGRL